MKTCRSNFDEDDRAREESLDSERANLRQGSSEKMLDEQVVITLSRLDSIEEGYRQFHSDMIDIVQQHPVSMRRENDKYHCDLAELIGVQPQVSTHLQKSPPSTMGRTREGRLKRARVKRGGMKREPRPKLLEMREKGRRVRVATTGRRTRPQTRRHTSGASRAHTAVSSCS